MSTLMPSDMFRDSAPFGYRPDTLQTSHIMGYGKDFSIFAESAIFGKYLQRDFQHLDVGAHLCLLAVDCYPKMFIEIGADIVFRQIFHVTERKPSECAEQEKIPVKFLFGVFQFAVYQELDFFCRKESSFCLFFLDFIFTERVSCQPAIVNGN